MVCVLFGCAVFTKYVQGCVQSPGPGVGGGGVGVGVGLKSTDNINNLQSHKWTPDVIYIAYFTRKLESSKSNTIT